MIAAPFHTARHADGRVTLTPLRALVIEPGSRYGGARVRQPYVSVADRPVVCGRCDLRAEHPQVASCTRTDCPLKGREAA